VTQPAPTPGQTGTDQTFAPAIMAGFRTGVQVLETGVKDIRAGWDRLVDAVNAFLQRVYDALEADHWWSQLFEWFTDDIKNGVDQIRRLIEETQPKINDILRTVEHAVNGSVPVLSLFQVGLDWTLQVNAPLSDIAPDLSPSGKIDSWRGPAHQSYTTRVQDQGEAVAAVVDKVKSTGLWLAEVARANTAYIVELADRVANVLGALVAAVVDMSEAGAGDLPAVQQVFLHLSEVVGEATTQFAQYLTGLADRLAEVLQQITELAAEYGDHTGLPQGRWPQAVKA
jgi:hypothetical protein